MTSTIFVPQFKAMSSYQSIQELIASVEKRISELEAGNQHLDELEALVSNARELYERLLVLRHKAYEEVASSEGEKEEQEQAQAQEEVAEEPEAEEKPDEINFTPNINPNQTSLIDAIVEIEKETGIPEAVVEEQAKVPEVPAIEVVAEVEEVNEIEEIQEQEDSEKSLVEQFAEENDSQSLAEKHVMSPIADLTKAIALNQKFLFINELFGGDSDAYNQAISELNNGGDSSAAMGKVNELKSQFTWENEEVAETFVTLIKRRHA